MTAKPESVAGARRGDGAPDRAKVPQTRRARSRPTAEPATAPERKPHRLPLDWAPRDATLENFRAQGWDPCACIEVFRDHWAASGQKTALKLDWEAAFRNWVREDIARGRGRPYVAPRPAPLAPEPRMDMRDPAVSAQVDLFLTELTAEGARRQEASLAAQRARDDDHARLVVESRGKA